MMDDSDLRTVLSKDQTELLLIKSRTELNVVLDNMSIADTRSTLEDIDREIKRITRLETELIELKNSIKNRVFGRAS